MKYNKTDINNVSRQDKTPPTNNLAIIPNGSLFLSLLQIQKPKINTGSIEINSNDEDIILTPHYDSFLIDLIDKNVKATRAEAKIIKQLGNTAIITFPLVKAICPSEKAFITSNEYIDTTHEIIRSIIVPNSSALATLKVITFFIFIHSSILYIIRFNVFNVKKKGFS